MGEGPGGEVGSAEPHRGLIFPIANQSGEGAESDENDQIDAARLRIKDGAEW